MADIFKNLAKGLTSIVKDTIKIRSLSKDDLQRLLRDNIEGHERIAHALNSYSNIELKDWMRDTVTPALKTSKSSSKEVFTNYSKKLRGKAQQLERDRPLNSLAKANEEFGKILEEISKKIDKLVANDTVDIFNVRMSHIALLGIIRQSDRVLNFSIYLYTFLTRVPSRSTNTIPKYREVYLNTHYEKIAEIVTLLLDKKGPYLFLKEIDTLRQRHSDLVLGATGSFDFVDFIMPSNFTPSFIDNLLSALSCLNIFSAALDMWDEYKLAKHERNKEIHKWLENHVALLKLDLIEVDKTSKEYMDLVNIIKAYEDNITEYDQKIITFEKEGEAV